MRRPLIVRVYRSFSWFFNLLSRCDQRAGVFFAVTYCGDKGVSIYTSDNTSLTERDINAISQLMAMREADPTPESVSAEAAPVLN